MVDLLQAAVGGLRAMLPQREVRYSRGGHYVDLDVTVAVTSVDYEDEHGVRMKAAIRDYIIDPLKLVLDGSQVEPEEGDTIIDTLEGATRTFEVMSTEGGVAWRYTDRFYTMLRIHTKQSDEA